MSNEKYGTLSLYFVYFDHHLGAAHSKHWSKYAFSTFFSKKLKKEEKERKFLQNLAKKCFLKFALERWLIILFPENL